MVLSLQLSSFHPYKYTKKTESIRMKKLLVITSLIFAFASTATTAKEEIGIDNKTPWGDVSITSHYFSKYVFNGFVAYDDPVVQSDITVAFLNGFSFNFWRSTDMKGKQTWGDEFDYTLAYAKSFADFDLDVSVSYFDCYKLLKAQGDSFDIKCKVSHNWEISEDQTLVPFAEINYYIPVQADGGSNGIVVEAGAKQCYQLNKTFLFSHQLSLLYDTGAYSMDSGSILKYQVGLEARINDNISFDVGIQAWKMLSSFHEDIRGIDGDQLVGMAGFTFTW